MSWYCAAILAFWVIDPEIRRLIDWRMGFHRSELLVVVPLAGMAVFAASVLFRTHTALPRPMALLAWIWIGCFSYAGVIGVLAGQGLSAIYDFIQFVAPIFIGLWLAVSGDSSHLLFKRLSTLVLAIGAVVSIYGIIQFVVLPPWDATWMIRVSSWMVSNGLAVPFQVRVFSVLASPAPCGAFLAVTIALNLHRLKAKRALPLMVLLLCAITLVLTLARSSWVALIVAVVVYLLFTGRVKAAVTALAFWLAVPAAFFGAAPWMPNPPGLEILAQRVGTFSDLGRDSSVQARTLTSGELLDQGLSNPLGQGLGLVGTTTQLSSFTHSINSTDGGLQVRFAEMGFFGFAGYAVTLLLALGLTLRMWYQAKRSRDEALLDPMATLLAVQIALVVLDFSLDAHGNLLGALFWTITGIALAHPQQIRQECAVEATSYVKGATSVLKPAT